MKQNEETIAVAAGGGASESDFFDRGGGLVSSRPGSSKNYMGAGNISSKGEDRENTAVGGGDEEMISPRTAYARSVAVPARSAGGQGQGQPGSPGGATPPAAAAPDATLRCDDDLFPF